MSTQEHRIVIRGELWPAFMAWIEANRYILRDTGGPVQRLTVAPATYKKKVPGLTSREMQILAGMARGLNNPEIGRELSIDRETVKTHASQIYKKIGVASRMDAVIYAIRQGLLIVTPGAIEPRPPERAA
ncbi:LuxR C-terminal-related transcriptional regulator [Amycolatopsis cynarae]|uniref:LuxR C-terminal-related transcriptional regulator n=1 Tax=Amycolatopsis cynarae TaxID=2995223 RepID=A0ABY7B569_9PSEU|nr:LuxR C-terminal-related transcriptional regulator [Amycolatopsis sp. HUAS 11-8]WAL67092.1 LuxR C-terminal-related transcriptional regulator [Amycolatopsis sp. HUAS 11-8]